MNKAILIGNLANDPEIRTTQSGIMQCNFRLAVQRRFANAQGVREADFIPIICWRQTAQLCGKYLAKGRKVAIEGSIQIRNYDAQDGTKRYVTEIIADNVEFLSAKGSADPGPEPPAYMQGNAPVHQTSMREMDGFTEVDTDELPF